MEEKLSPAKAMNLTVQFVEKHIDPLMHPDRAAREKLIKDMIDANYRIIDENGLINHNAQPS